MTKVSDLTVILNKRRAEELAAVKREFAERALHILKTFDDDMVGFSMTVWGRDSGIKTYFHRSDDVPKNLLGEFVRRDIEREISLSDARTMLEAALNSDGE